VSKVCKKCGIEKPLDQFEKNKTCREGRTNRCIACHAAYHRGYSEKHKDKIKNYHREHYAKKQGPGYVRKWGRVKSPEELAAYQERKKVRARELALQQSYGVTLEMYATMLATQGGVCAICKKTNGRSSKPLYIDHDHATGAVRELLCHYCNTLLGNAKDDPARLEQAASYLRKHSA
jgi:hypothetical protein